MKFETLAIHAGQEPDPNNGAVMTPVYLTSTYMQDGVAKPRQGYEYSRTINPTRKACRIVSQRWKVAILGWLLHPDSRRPIRFFVCSVRMPMCWRAMTYTVARSVYLTKCCAASNWTLHLPTPLILNLSLKR